MRVAALFCLGTIAVILAGYLAQLNADQTLKRYAVHVVRDPKENWTGTGVYLGNGLVLTAGHVAGEPWNKIRVEIDGREFATEVLKRGQFSTVDLALVAVDERRLPRRLRRYRTTLCQQWPWPGEEVIVATPEAAATSHVISPDLLPADVALKFWNAISDVATTGNSGSGVFDAYQKCLLGIISGKIQANKPNEPGGIAKFFVPAPTIAEFLPPQYRF